jgi:ATP-dependent Clp protease ATP-binding subunit ClpX
MPTADPPCSFCGKGPQDVRRLVAGPKDQICDECLGLCRDIIAEDEGAEERPRAASLATLQQDLAERIVGQAAAVRALAAVLERSLDASAWQNVAARALLLGPAGTGKTELARAAAEVSGLPFSFVEATRFRADDPRTARDEALLPAAPAGGARQGVLCIEHLDRIALTSGDPERNRRAQQALLRLVDGTALPGGWDSPWVPTAYTLIIATGRFEGLREQVDDAALVQAGLCPELATRLDVRLRLEPLGLPELRRLLTAGKRPWLRDEHRLARGIDGEVVLPVHRLDEICAQAVRLGGGGWGLARALAVAADDGWRTFLAGRRERDHG